MTLALVGCLAPGSTTCLDGRICPVKSRCDEANHRCIEDSTELACIGVAEAGSCTLVGAPGICHNGACKPFACGDGMRTGTEECDGSDLGGKTCKALGFYADNPGLKCGVSCKFDTSGCQGACGDGMINGPELCDGFDLGGADCRTAGFYDAAGLRCSPFCTFDVADCKGTCGDGITNGPEVCDGAPPSGQNCLDYGYDRGLLACSALCGPVFADCEQIGWKAAATETENMFVGLWGSGPTDLFAVGPGGIVAHWEGATWSDMSSGTINTLSGVWGSGPSDVFAVGDNTIIHWDGSKWSGGETLYNWALTAVWGFAPDDAYAVGFRGETNGVPDERSVIMHWDGKAWSETMFPGTDLGAIWGSRPDDIWVAGTSLMHWDGSTWSSVKTDSISTPFVVASIWGSSASDVFAVGGQGFIMHWDGRSWFEMDPGTQDWFSSVWGSGPNDVFAGGTDLMGHDVVFHWDGIAWSPIATFPNSQFCCFPLGLAGWKSSRGDVFIAGTGIRHFDGTSWFTTMVTGATAMWAADADHLFVSDQGMGGIAAPVAMKRWSGTQVMEDDLVASPQGSNSPPVDMWGRGNDVLAVGNDHQLHHWNGTSWSEVFLPEGSPAVDFYGVWGASSADAWTVGKITDVTASCSKASKTPGVASHWDGTRWTTPVTVSSRCLAAVWMAGPKDVFAVGAVGTVVRWDGAQWRAMSVPSTEDLLSIWGSGPGDVYAAGTAGTILHFDGSNWTTMKTETKENFVRVQGSGAGDVFLMGGSVLLHLRASIWEHIALPQDLVATRLSVTPSRVFIAGFRTAEQDEIIQLDRPVSCVGPETNCNDGWDNDCDGLQDAADPDCLGKVPEQCANLIDDDGDGLIDCKDPDCAQFPSCKTTRP
jgi:hypothetical protein